jgi:hypothetical protein
VESKVIVLGSRLSTSATLLLALSACAHASSVAAPESSPSPYLHPMGSNFSYGTYSVLDMRRPNAPRLSPIQTKWLDLIHRDHSYSGRWRKLRFSLVAEQRLPLIVFVRDDHEDLFFHDYGIIGEACDVYFDPAEGTVTATPHFDKPCSRSEQLTVNGEKTLLGWAP